MIQYKPLLEKNVIVTQWIYSFSDELPVTCRFQINFRNIVVQFFFASGARQCLTRMYRFWRSVNFRQTSYLCGTNCFGSDTRKFSRGLYLSWSLYKSFSYIWRMSLSKRSLFFGIFFSISGIFCFSNRVTLFLSAVASGVVRTTW